MERIRQWLWAHLRFRAAAYLVLLVASVPVWIVYWRAESNVRSRDVARFSAIATNTSELILTAFERFTADLNSVGGLFEASSSVLRSEWDSFVDKLDFPRRHPSVRSISFAQRVTADQRAQFVKSMRARVGPEFEIIPAATVPLMFPIVFGRQFPTNVELQVGWDVYAEQLKRPALDSVMMRAQPAVTPKMAYWLNGRPQVDGFTVFIPVQSTNRDVRGVVFSSFIPQYFFNTLSNRQFDGTVSVEMFDGSEAGAGSLLASYGLPASPSTSSLSEVVPIRLLDRNFVLRFQSLPRFAESSDAYLPKIVLACGLCFSFLIFGITWRQGNSRSAADKLNCRLRESEEQLLAANTELHSKIAESRLTEELLAYERDLLNTLLEHSPDSIYFKNLESRFIRCSKAVVRHLSLDSTSAAVGRSDFDFFAEEHARPAYEMEQEIIRTGKPVIGHVEKEVGLNGRESWALSSKMPLRDKNGKIIGTFGITKDISALKSIEHALEDEKELLGVTLRSIADGVITTDVEGRIVLFNKVAEELTGWTQPEAVGRDLKEVFRLADAPEGRSVDAEAVDGRASTQAGRDCVLLARDGSKKSISQSLAPIIDMTGEMMGAVLVVRDITEKLKIEAELLKAGKLESIGVLAGGIAHDFNNILTVILGNIALARMGENVGRSRNELLGEAERASLRARELTQRLLTFSKGGAPIKKPLEIASLVQECTARTLQNTGVEPEFHLADGLWAVAADESQLEQVLHNLLSFVRTSLSTNPRLDIHVLNHELESDPMLCLTPGSYVRISIRDYGSGLKPEQLGTIFEPYFGPKRNGSGLELATAYSIVRKHDGQIRVESIAGQGTIFHVYLPAALERAIESVEPRKPLATSREPRRILVMDDELPLRELAAHLLERLGHKVETAADGEEAIRFYQAALQGAEPFDAVIMDLTIPHGMGGQETISELRQIDPNVKAIVCSGYSNDPVMANFKEHGFGGVVPKPYSPDDLAMAVDELLAGADDLQNTSAGIRA